MNQVIQTCTQKGHEQNKVKYACFYSECKMNRMLCSQCLLHNIHKHGNENNSHILDHQGIEQLIQQKLNQLQQYKNQDQDLCNQFAQSNITFIKKIQELIQIIVNMLKQLQYSSFYTDKIDCLNQKLSNIKNKKLNFIDNEFIISLTDIDIQQSKLPQIQLINNYWDNMSKVIQSSKQLWEQLKQISNIKDAKYMITQIYQSEKCIYAATQSNDLKYIVSGERDGILNIWDYSNLKLIKQAFVESGIRCVKFTDDSQFLYGGLWSGLLYCFDVSMNFKQIYKQKIHDSYIENLYCVTNTIILTLSYQTIIKTDTQLNQQVFVIKDPSQFYGLDYHKLKNIIASSNQNQSIQLWKNSDGQLIMKQGLILDSVNYFIYQVLFVIEYDQLLSGSHYVINIWQINYNDKIMMPIKSIRDFNVTSNISFINNQQIILLIFEEYINFYTRQGEQIRTIKHDIKALNLFSGSNSLQFEKSIIIKGISQLAICRVL